MACFALAAKWAKAKEKSMEENREIEIDLKKIFTMLKKRLIFIVLVGLIGATISGCITNFFITPQYTTNVKLYVSSNTDNLLGSGGSISQNELDASTRLVNTYLVVVRSDNFLEKVADRLGDGTTASSIKSMISCSQIDETLAFQVNVTSSNPQRAADVANAIAETCPSEIVRVLKVGGVEVIDYAKVPTSPSSPNLKKNVLIGLIAGLALSFVFFFIKEMFDTRIITSKDLEKDFSIPVLGSIPRLVPVEASKDAIEKKDQSSLIDSILSSDKSKKEEK